MSTLVTIQGTDLPTNSRANINDNFSALNADKMETSVLDTDTTLAAASDSKVATQKAVKAYVDAGGNVNASTTAKGIVELATSAEIDAGTATGATGAALVVTADALKGSLAPIVRSYVVAGSPHTWSKPAGLKYIVVEGVGGGGHGQDGVAGGGAGYFKKLISTSSLGTTETVTVGVAGTTGGTTSFGAHCSATGGVNSGTPGTATGGDINITGGEGNDTVGGNNGHNYGLPGGDSILGHGGRGGTYQSAGGSATGYGSGGGSGGEASGGNGSDGIVIVTEYYV